MKTATKLLLIVTLTSVALSVAAQQTPPRAVSKPLNRDFLFSIRGGYDVAPMFKPELNRVINENPVADFKPLSHEFKMKSGLHLGTGLDYYWKWIGIGADFDYIKNSPSVTFDNTAFEEFDFQDSNTEAAGITRMFYGIGPNFRYQPETRDFSIELNTRVGLGSIKGGKTDIMAGYDKPFNPSGNNVEIFSFKGIDAKNLLSFKGQLRFTYYVNEMLGINAGAYYLHHTKAPYTEPMAPDNPYSYGQVTPELKDVESNYGSLGLFAGLTLRISPKAKAPSPKVVPSPAPAPAPAQIILNGKVVVCEQATPIVGATVVIVNNRDNSERAVLSDNKGNFSLAIPPNTSFTIRAKKQNFFSSVITVAEQPAPRENKSVDVEICMDKVDCDESVRLNNIHYDLDKADIRPDARPELNRLVQFLKDNPEARIELSSHTDSRGSHAYNEQLSQRRADSAKAYVVSQGINASRIVSVGYGERKLLNRCADGVLCSEAEHQLNRRTEMKVICPE